VRLFVVELPLQLSRLHDLGELGLTVLEVRKKFKFLYSQSKYNQKKKGMLQKCPQKQQQI
jgi:hypothetical protein